MNVITRENCADILCIGAQKASTSWLHHVINAHPRAYSFPNSKPITSTNKEAHFWDWNRQRGVDWYRSLMAPPEPDLLSLDFTPEYSLMSMAQIEECKQLNPSARVIFVLRDPLVRAISALRMHTLWRMGKDREKEAQIEFGEDFLNLIKHAKIVEMSSYMANYMRWAKYYDDILVLNYEDIVANPHDVIARVYAHCGLDIETMPAEARAEFDKRMEKRVWTSVPYPVQSQALYFLHGLLWPKREAAERYFNFQFHEYKGFLDIAD